MMIREDSYYIQKTKSMHKMHQYTNTIQLVKDLLLQNNAPWKCMLQMCQWSNSQSKVKVNKVSNQRRRHINQSLKKSTCTASELHAHTGSQQIAYVHAEQKFFIAQTVFCSWTLFCELVHRAHTWILWAFLRQLLPASQATLHEVLTTRLRSCLNIHKSHSHMIHRGDGIRSGILKMELEFFRNFQSWLFFY